MKDSVVDDRKLAITMLNGLALPEDMKRVPEPCDLNLEEMYSHIVQV